jgi:alkylhydroperoxidase family enzyme
MTGSEGASMPATRGRSAAEGPFLPPIDEPQDASMKQTYAMMRQYFGKVFTPTKVFSARMPPAFNELYTKVGALDQELTLPRETAILIRGQVARINVCLFCIDTNRWGAIRASMNEAKLDELDRYGTSPLFTEAERAALDYATELTRDKRIDPETFARLAACYSEREVCEIVWLVASEHLFNMTNIGLNIHSDMLCETDGRKG